MPSSTLATLDRLIEAFTTRRKWRALGPIERKLELALQTAFRKQGRAFLAALNHRAGVLAGRLREAPGDILPPNWMALFDIIAAEQEGERGEVVAGSFQSAIQKRIEDALVAGAQHTMADFSVAGAFDLANPRTAAYLETHAATAVAGINEATQAEMRTLITAGAREGQTYDQIARGIRDRFAGFSTPAPQQHIRSRAHLVAVTETGNAYEAGNRAVVDDLTAAGLQMEKSWLTVGDGRVDADCEDNASAGWIPLADTFPSGADEPTAHPACRCTALYRRVPSSARAAA